MSKDWKSWSRREYLDDETLEYLIDLFNQLFTFHNIDPKNMTALEIGAGHGINTIWLKKIFKKITAVEPEEALVKIFKEHKELIDIEIHIVDCENINLHKKFNCIIFTSSFMWVDDKQQCLLKITKHLKKNGYLIIIEPKRFLTTLVDGFPNNVIRMIDVIETIVRSKKLKLIHILPTDKSMIYLLKS